MKANFIINSSFLTALLISNGCSPLLKSQAKLTVSTQSSSNILSPQNLSSDFCYALNVTGPSLEITPSPNVSCDNASGGKGQFFGLYNVGDSAEITVPVGPARRIDLLAFKKPASGCSGVFKVDTPSFAGKFGGTLDTFSISENDSYIAGSTTLDIVPGANEAVITKTATAEKIVCSGAPKLSKIIVNPGDTSTILIEGENLLKVTKVALKDESTEFNLSAQSDSNLVVRPSSPLNLSLGSLYKMIVHSAYGQDSTSIELTIPAGSIKPEHLDMTQDWPFEVPKAVTVSLESDVSRVNFNENLPIGNVFDKNDSTFIQFDIADGYYYSAPLDFAALKLVFGNLGKKYNGEIRALTSTTRNDTYHNNFAVHLLANFSDLQTSANLVNSKGWSNSMTFNNAREVYLKIIPNSTYYNPAHTINIYEFEVTARAVE